MSNLSDYSGLAKRLAAVRAKTGLSQEIFAARLGTSRGAYQYYERNEREIPLSLVKRCAVEFDYDLYWLIYDDGEEQILKRNQKTYAAINFLARYVEARVAEMGRLITTENTVKAAQHLHETFLKSTHDVDNLSSTQKTQIDNVIEMVSIAA